MYAFDSWLPAAVHKILLVKGAEHEPDAVLLFEGG